MHQTLWRRVENLLDIRKDFFLSKMDSAQTITLRPAYNDGIIIRNDRIITRHSRIVMVETMGRTYTPKERIGNLLCVKEMHFPEQPLD